MCLHDLSTRCPYCGKANDLHGNVGGAQHKPRAGSLSLCHSCKQVAVFYDVCAGRLALRKPSRRQREAMAADEQLAALLEQARRMTPGSMLPKWVER